MEDAAKSITDEPGGNAGATTPDSMVTTARSAQVVIDFFASVRFSQQHKTAEFIEQDPEIVHVLDSDGYSCVHWAAKKGDVGMLQYLHEKGADITLPTTSDSKMLPIHWAASDGKIESIRFFLGLRRDLINAQDSNGCTPVIIATQHKHVTCVVFCVKVGADLEIRDTNGDTALHWAAYKGFVDCVGALAYVAPQALEYVDMYGQTALHLAALRGNTDVVEFLILECHADANKTDKLKLTIVELASNKKHFDTEWAIRRIQYPSTFKLVQHMGIGKLTNMRVFAKLFFGVNQKEISVWPWRIVFWSNLVATYITFFVFMGSEVMADCAQLHLINTMIQVFWWTCFIILLFCGPGFVTNPIDSVDDDKSNASSMLDGDKESQKVVSSYPKNSYDDELMKIEHAVRSEDCSALCHSCRVKKPLRSKHCPIQRRCCHKFDHFCPFVGNSIGRDNYRFFCGVVVSHPLVFALWCYTARIYSLRVAHISWMFIIYIGYSGLWLLMMLSLLTFHAQLVIMNMTTNEQINGFKYSYMRNEFGIGDNPFRKATLAGNIMDVIFPLKHSFYSREEVVAMFPRPSMGEQGWTSVDAHEHHGGCSHNHDHSHGHSHDHGSHCDHGHQGTAGYKTLDLTAHGLSRMQAAYEEESGKDADSVPLLQAEGN